MRSADVNKRHFSGFAVLPAEKLAFLQHWQRLKAWREAPRKKWQSQFLSVRFSHRTWQTDAAELSKIKPIALISWKLDRVFRQAKRAFTDVWLHNDTDLIKVKYLKVHVGRKSEPFYLQYSAEEKGWSSLTLAWWVRVMNSKGKINLYDLKERLTDILINPMERKRLIAILTDEFSCGQRTVEERLKAMIESKEALLNHQGQDCCLEKETENRLKIYRLSPIDTNSN